MEPRDCMVSRVWPLMMAATVVLSGACDKAQEAPGASTASAAVAPPVGANIAAVATPHAAKAEPTLLELLETTGSLADAIEVVKEQMTDTDDETSPGALLLAVWAAKHLRWSEVGVAKNETSFAMVRKDSDAARGKRMCVRGSIIQIQKEKLGDTTLFGGLLITGYTNITSFLAVGTTGSLVAQSRARFCGVVVGTYDYSNSGGGKGHAISLVGMFDLKDNHSAE